MRYKWIRNMETISEYMPRVADEILQNCLRAKGAVLIEGAKWCGKTSTARHKARSEVSIDDPRLHTQYMNIAMMEPTLLLEGETPRLIDEWQLAPGLWDTVRNEVDRRGKMNQFILTGSALPADVDKVHHSGIGRIARMRMRPMTLRESGESNGKVSLMQLFDGKMEPCVATSLNLSQIAYLIARGGWPLAVHLPEREALQQAIDYYDSLVNVDLIRLGGRRRSPARVRSILRSYARYVGAPGKVDNIVKDVEGNGSFSISRPTVVSYLEELQNLFVLEPAKSWNPNLRSKIAIRSADTFYFSDPSIAVASLSLGPQDLLRDLETMGLLFENMAIRDLRVFTEALGGDVFHYRDSGCNEVDAVLHLRDGRYALVEIKLGGEAAIEQAACSFVKVLRKLNTKKMGSPAFCMVLTAVGDYAYRRPTDGVFVVPIGALGP